MFSRVQSWLNPCQCQIAANQSMCRSRKTDQILGVMQGRVRSVLNWIATLQIPKGKCVQMKSFMEMKNSTWHWHESSYYAWIRDYMCLKQMETWGSPVAHKFKKSEQTLVCTGYSQIVARVYESAGRLKCGQACAQATKDGKMSLHSKIISSQRTSIFYLDFSLTVPSTLSESVLRGYRSGEWMLKPDMSTI
jgi:hypothetical protein